MHHGPRAHSTDGPTPINVFPAGYKPRRQRTLETEPSFRQEIPVEIVNAVSDSMDEWYEIAVAQYLGEAAYRDAEWIACTK
jgi:hypothetical protein